MPGISQGSRGIVSEGLSGDMKFGDDSTRAIADGLLFVEASVVEALSDADAQQIADHRLRRHLGVKRGFCMDCKEPIAEARLKAVPFASRCKSCQEAVEP
jgi:RNA polymerase-binding transcription factor DksA